MKVITKVTSVLIFAVFALNLCRSQDGPVNNRIDSECDIPNQSKTKGSCVKRQNCSDYDQLFDVDELTTERLSFIINLDCGFDYETWKPLVCCPKPGQSYKYVC